MSSLKNCFLGWTKNRRRVREGEREREKRARGTRKMWRLTTPSFTGEKKVRCSIHKTARKFWKACKPVDGIHAAAMPTKYPKGFSGVLGGSSEFWEKLPRNVRKRLRMFSTAHNDRAFLSTNPDNLTRFDSRLHEWNRDSVSVQKKKTQK